LVPALFGQGVAEEDDFIGRQGVWVRHGCTVGRNTEKEILTHDKQERLNE
jgi:hypothetical protein